jgi:hypothetical protein
MVYPFFLMISAFGFINLIESESQWFQKQYDQKRIYLKTIFLSAFFLIFFISPWFRITLHIPFFQDGGTNLAVGFDEWREASQIVKDRQKPGDLIISSLPIASLYYGTRPDYGLNWANYSQAKEERIQNQSGRWADVYAGVTCIESLDELQKITRTHQRGWILVSKFHQVKDFILKDIGKPAITKQGTILVYHWENKTEAGR